MLFNTKLTDEQNDCLGYIKTSSQTLLSLINDILDFSKIEAGKLEIENLEFDLNRVLYEVAGIITPLLDAKKLRVDIANTFALKHLLIGDPNRIRQVILNFATNAIKFSREGDIKILFELVSETESDATFTLGVEDRGIGVAPEKIEHIFSPFVQADSSTTRRFGGTGLGLAISNQLVKLMGAEKISVESQVGAGSKFYFILTLKKGSLIKGAAVNRPAISLKKSLAGEKLRAKILLAEDSPANVALMAKLMKILGHDISIADNGIKAVEAAKSEKFDLIFMDVQMPEMDGIEATRKIREFDREIPIVAMTAGAMKDDVDSCIAAGMNAHTSKPINVMEIEGLIKKYAAGPKAPAD
jgi:CheY-like chemotaxis protein